jgi:molybdenum ABC transporter, periplasmic molybdate-binding protein
MSHPLRRLLCLIALAMALTATPAVAQTRAPLTVFAAASLKESLDEAAAAYQRSSGTSVQVSYAASSALARQVEQGAPADVFFSADLEWMDYLQQRQLVDPAQRRNLLGNTLVLVAPASSTIKVDLRKRGALAAALGAQGRLAVGQTSSVPAGKYARAALQALGQWDGVQARLAESESVRSALMLVARGETPLGIVYGSDAKAEPKVRVVAVFPADSHAPIVYPVAALRASTHPAAADFVRWLGTPPAQAIFQRRGFSLAH